MGEGVLSRGKVQVNREHLGSPLNTGETSWYNWEFGQMPQGLFLRVDVEGGRSRGVGLVKEERSYLTRKLLPGVWARQGIVSLLEGRVRSGAELSGGPLSSSLRRWGLARDCHSPTLKSILETGPQHPHGLLLPSSGWLAALVHPLPPLPCPLGADTRDRPLASLHVSGPIRVTAQWVP